MNIIHRFFAVVLGAAGLSVAAAEPAGYYSTCENKQGTDLLNALFKVVGPHTTVSYDGLYELYKTSDSYPDNTIWDMYSTKHWGYGSKCGNYKNIGDCYNREHSFPKSWFSEGKPMYSDAYHLYPTDGKVNGQRSNYPYGECSGGTYVTPKDGVRALGRLGKSTFAGYSGTVFEPDDEYKGDFARSYFYMAVAYYDKIAGWSSPMLAGKSHPAFTTWAVNLLLKWHRQDPVSQKELDRVEAVYGSQRNRNPFIDHPELAEYIWGNKVGERWTSGASAVTTINQPVDGSTFDLGTSAAGFDVSRKFQIKTSGAKSVVNLAVSGAAFSVAPSTVAADVANTGTTVTVTYTPSSVGTHTGTLTATCGDVRSAVSLRGRAVDGLPIDDPSHITDESFELTWTYIGDEDAGGVYILEVRDESGMLDGYPCGINAAAGTYVVEGLMPDTEYSVRIMSRNLVSEEKHVRTAQALPGIDFLFDGDLYFTTMPGEPSEHAEILIALDNIDCDFTVTVQAPFELSTDLANWSRSLTLAPEETRMYMRVFGDTSGEYETSLAVRAGEYYDDGTTVAAFIGAEFDIVEDFEAEGNYSSYSTTHYQGNTMGWNVNDAGIWSSDKAHGGRLAMRLGKTSSSSIAMDTDTPRGIGMVSFWAKRFGSDGEAEIAVEVSTDGGSSYRTVATVPVTATEYTEHRVQCATPGSARLQLRQTSGVRVMLDDISIARQSTGLDAPEDTHHQWTAFVRDGILVVDVVADSLDAAIYAIDGTTIYSGALLRGRHTFDMLAPDTVYIVVVDDFARTVLVR